MTSKYSLAEMSTDLIREFPDLAPELLTTVFGVELPGFATVAAWEPLRDSCDHPLWIETYNRMREEGRTVAPLMPESYLPSEQLILAYADIVDKLPAHVMLFEGICREDDQKSLTWPFRVAELRARYRCDATLMVFCADETTETWASETIHTGQPNWDFQPLVLGSDTIPVVTSAKEAARNPPMAILSAMCHTGDPEHGDDVFRSALQGLGSLGDEAFECYLNRLLAALDDEVADRMKGKLLTDTRIEDFFEKYARSFKLSGRMYGAMEGEARALLRVLEARDIDVPERARQQILKCRSAEKLETWLTRAATAKGLYQVFDLEDR